MFLSSCTTTQYVPKVEYVTQIPAKISRPNAPVFTKLDNTKSIADKNNFRILQTNIVLLKNYTVSLENTIQYYESEINRLNQAKVQ